jgi:uncharacterized NAD(P)/FAD-binding protein YdhS
MLRVAIVGAGPGGIYALRDLLRSSTAVSVTLFETGAKPGLGTPYDPALNHPGLLANIASFELPPVVDTLCGWLAGLSPAAREALGVAEVSERAFYPRVALGAYFTAQYEKLADEAGGRITLRADTEVVDVAARPDGVRIAFVADGELAQAEFDYAILATGHTRPREARPLTHAPYPAPDLPDQPLRVAVLGASLTAIDAALALAWKRGEFLESGQGLEYRLRPGAPALRIDLLSRRGVLPEADFYFPYPYRPLRFCTRAAMRALAAAPENRLDLAFALLRRDLEAEDADYARRIGLKGLNADSFADAYFRLRGGADPFAAARRNLSEARANLAARRVSGFRYALLRAHEMFAELVPSLDDEDRARFRGLQRVIADNYAAVPPLSVERLLALHEAGVLDLRRVGSDYALEAAGEGVEIVEGEAREAYDLVIDARGERAAQARELPFPTLRVQALANQMAERRGDLAVDEDFRLAAGINPVGRVFCLAAPFLLTRRPFVQGLTAVEEMAGKAVARLLEREDEPAAPTLATGALYLGGGLVVATPHMS